MGTRLPQSTLPLHATLGIIAGCFLISLMGSKAFIGGTVAVVAGVITYYVYGRKHYEVHRETPFQAFRATLRKQS